MMYHRCWFILCSICSCSTVDSSPWRCGAFCHGRPGRHRQQNERWVNKKKYDCVVDDGSTIDSASCAITRLANHVFHGHRDILVTLRGGDILLDRSVAAVPVDYSSFIESAYGWCVNLGNPSALVAGAVVATLYENVHSGDLVASEYDSYWVQLGKKVTHLLLLSAFALEVVAIFVTTVTGTMLLSQAPELMTLSTASVSSPLDFLRENFEFEYLTARISFLQGVLNWLAAIALTHVLPLPVTKENPRRASVEAFNKFVGVSILTVIAVMMSFYNNHMTFYNNYPAMLCRWAHVTMQYYFRIVGGPQTWPPRPLSLILSPLLILSVYWGYQALTLYERPPTHTMGPGKDKTGKEETD